MRGCHPVPKALALLTLTLVAAEVQGRTALEPGEALGFTVRALAAPILWLLFTSGVALVVGYVTRSIVAGVGTHALLSQHQPPVEFLGVLGWAITLAGLSAASYKGGLWDSVLEYIGSFGRARVSPALAAVTVAYALYILGGPYSGHPHYWLLVALGAGIASKSVAGGPRDLLLGVLAGATPLGALAASYLASFMPVEPPHCSGVEVGRLVAVEAETSASRLPYSTRRWRSRGLACVRSGKAVLSLDTPYTLWVYSRQPGKWSVKVSGLLGCRRPVVVSLDEPGPEDLGGLAREVQGKQEGTVRTGFARLPSELWPAALAVVLEEAGPDCIVIESCRAPIDLLSRLSFQAAEAVVVVSTCNLSSESLVPARGRGGGGFLLVEASDPLSQASVFERLLGPDWRRVESLIRGTPLVIAYPVCGRVALVEVTGGP